MIDRLDHQRDQCLHVEGIAPPDPGVPGAEGEGDRIDALLDRRLRHRLRLQAFRQRRRGLSFGQPVDAVVEDDVGHVDVAAAAVDEVAGADAIPVTIAAHRDHGQLVVGQLGTGRHRQRAPMEGVQPVGVDVVRGLARAANAGNHRHPVGRDLQLKERLLDRAQDTEVAAARAPVDMDFRLVLLQRELLRGGGGLRHGTP